MKDPTFLCVVLNGQASGTHKVKQMMHLLGKLGVRVITYVTYNMAVCLLPTLSIEDARKQV